MRIKQAIYGDFPNHFMKLFINWTSQNVIEVELDVY